MTNLAVLLMLAMLAVPRISVRDGWIMVHEQERMRRVSEQGSAAMIPALEYHGDNYYFYNGAYELGPAGFAAQMQWFDENDVHAVTGDELVRWMAGEIDLPRRSVVLTFDLGNRSVEPIYRMLDVFEQTGMHGIFTVWVSYMGADESVNCREDVCWQAFRDAYNSGMATLGSHTLTHRDFATVSAAEGLDELADSRRIIEENTGVDVNVLTWPFESIPAWGDRLQEVGFGAAFGGNTYALANNAIHEPEDWYQLPRVLPPNTNGISGRPSGRTLAEMMEMYWR